MNLIIIKIMFSLGIKKAILKLSTIVALSAVVILELVHKYIPEYFLGVTIFLWLIYVVTVSLDWATGITAARIEARRNQEKFKFDREKSLTSFYKHALFLVIIAFIYFLQEETIRKEMGYIVINSLTGIQFGFFTYNIVTEFISIEDNRFRVTGKKSRLSKVMTLILDSMDKKIINKVDNLMDVELKDKNNKDV